MLEWLKGYEGALEVNGVHYNTLEAALEALKSYEGELVVRIDRYAVTEPQSLIEPTSGYVRYKRVDFSEN